MKHQAILATLCGILFSVVGCERNHSITGTSTSASFNVNGETGIAKGLAFGVEFKAESASGVDTRSALGASQEFSSQAWITLADDLKIKLQTKRESELVTFNLNGSSFGELKAGDKVVIAKDRSVTVNGEKRALSESTPE